MSKREIAKQVALDKSYERVWNNESEEEFLGHFDLEKLREVIADSVAKGGRRRGVVAEEDAAGAGGGDGDGASEDARASKDEPLTTRSKTGAGIGKTPKEATKQVVVEDKKGAEALGAFREGARRFEERYKGLHKDYTDA